MRCQQDKQSGLERNGTREHWVGASLGGRQGTAVRHGRQCPPAAAVAAARGSGLAAAPVRGDWLEPADTSLQGLDTAPKPVDVALEGQAIRLYVCGGCDSVVYPARPGPCHPAGPQK